MEKENEVIKIYFFTNNKNKYNNAFIENLYKKICDERIKIIEKLELKDVRKVIFNLYDNSENFKNEIKKFYSDYKVPVYCKGTIQRGQIYFLVDTKIEEKTYKYELQLRKILHEYIHILYNEYIAGSENRITWLDEGLALNLSKEKGKFIKERFPILESDINEINLNKLQHEKGTFVTEKVNGYELSYLTVKYLMEILSSSDFNRIIRQREEMLKIRGKCMA